MATYPTTLTIGYGSSRSSRSGRSFDFDGDGLARSRKLHATRHDFSVVHPGLDATAWAAFLAFFEARDADNDSFTFYWLDGSPYTVQFDEPPYSVDEVGPNLRTVTVKLKAAE